MLRLSCIALAFVLASRLPAVLGQAIALPDAPSALILDTKTGGTEQMPLCVQFAPDDKSIYVRSWYNRTQNSVTAVALEKRTQSSLIITRCPSMNNRSDYFTFASDRSFYTISNTLSDSALHLIVDEGGKLTKRSFKLPWDDISNMQCYLRRIDKETLRLTRETAESDVESILFDTEKMKFGSAVSLGKYAKDELGSFLYDSGAEFFCSVRRPKIPSAYFLVANPSDKKPDLKPILTVKDGCISFQIIDDFYVIGSVAGRLSFVTRKGKKKPLEGQVLQMCIQQIAVRSEGEGIYTCLVCGADEGNSFAVARVNTKAGTIQSKTFKITSKPAKCLAAFSNDGKSFALIDYNLKLSIFKTEQFKNLE